MRSAAAAGDAAIAPLEAADEPATASLTGCAAADGGVILGDEVGRDPLLSRSDGDAATGDGEGREAKGLCRGPSAASTRGSGSGRATLGGSPLQLGGAFTLARLG